MEIANKCRLQVLIVVAAFTINFTACGLLYGFGVYQAHYETMALEKSTPFTGASPAEIDLIGSLSNSAMILGAPFAVAWAKNWNAHLVICAGGLLYGIASVLASFGTALWHFQITQGLLLGVATCLSLMCSMTVVPTWFDRHRALAMGIISSGTGIGGLVWAPALRSCIDQMGFRNTLRLTGTIAAVFMFAAGCVIGWEPSMAAQLHAENEGASWVTKLCRIPLPDWKTAKQRKFIAQALGTALQSAAYATPVFFLASYAKTLGYNDVDGANFTAVSNASNAIGKIAAGFIADRVGRLNAFFLTTFLSSGVTMGLWVPSTIVGTSNKGVGRSLFIAFTVLYSIFASPYVSLFPATLVELFGVSQLPRVAGIMYMMQGVGAIIGTPVAGVLIKDSKTARSSDDYTGMAILVGELLFATTVMVAWVRIEAAKSHTGEKRQRKWKL